MFSGTKKKRTKTEDGLLKQISTILGVTLSDADISSSNEAKLKEVYGKLAEALIPNLDLWVDNFLRLDKENGSFFQEPETAAFLAKTVMIAEFVRNGLNAEDFDYNYWKTVEPKKTKRLLKVVLNYIYFRETILTETVEQEKKREEVLKRTEHIENATKRKNAAKEKLLKSKQKEQNNLENVRQTNKKLRAETENTKQAVARTLKTSQFAGKELKNAELEHSLVAKEKEALTKKLRKVTLQIEANPPKLKKELLALRNNNQALKKKLESACLELRDKENVFAVLPALLKMVSKRVFELSKFHALLHDLRLAAKHEKAKGSVFAELGDRLSVLKTQAENCFAQFETKKKELGFLEQREKESKSLLTKTKAEFEKNLLPLQEEVRCLRAQIADAETKTTGLKKENTEVAEKENWQETELEKALQKLEKTLQIYYDAIDSF